MHTATIYEAAPAAFPSGLIAAAGRVLVGAIFVLNIAMAGGLLQVAAFSSGRFGFDRR